MEQLYRNRFLKEFVRPKRRTHFTSYERNILAKQRFVLCEFQGRSIQDLIQYKDLYLLKGKKSHWDCTHDTLMDIASTPRQVAVPPDIDGKRVGLSHTIGFTYGDGFKLFLEYREKIKNAYEGLTVIIGNPAENAELLSLYFCQTGHLLLPIEPYVTHRYGLYSTYQNTPLAGMNKQIIVYGKKDGKSILDLVQEGRPHVNVGILPLIIPR